MQNKTIRSILKPSFDLKKANEIEFSRIKALNMALKFMEAVDYDDFECLLFGSALRRGDFYPDSDLDFAFFNKKLIPVDFDIQRLIKKKAYDEISINFDLLFFPLKKEQIDFQNRILNTWGVNFKTIKNHLNENSHHSVNSFYLEDIFFICNDRLNIAESSIKSAIIKITTETDSNFNYIATACMESLYRILKKSAKDILRHWFADAALNWDGDLISLLIFPLDDNHKPILSDEIIFEKNKMDNLFFSISKKETDNSKNTIIALLTFALFITKEIHSQINTFLINEIKLFPKMKSLSSKTLSNS